MTNINNDIAAVVSAIKPPHTTQDATDVLGSELYVAGILRGLANKRYDKAKDAFVKQFERRIEDVRTQADRDMLTSKILILGTEWNVEVKANTPQVGVDIDKLTTELVKAGVKLNTVQECMKKAEKRAKPATFFECVQVNA